VRVICCDEDTTNHWQLFAELRDLHLDQQQLQRDLLCTQVRLRPSSGAINCLDCLSIRLYITRRFVLLRWALRCLLPAHSFESRCCVLRNPHKPRLQAAKVVYGCFSQLMRAADRPCRQESAVLLAQQQLCQPGLELFHVSLSAWQPVPR
jgi:hypothetical protein